MTHCEQFNTTEHAIQFQKLSTTSLYIPATLHRHTNTCIVQTVKTPSYKTLSKKQLKTYLYSILHAIKQGISYNIYHLDIKKEHLGSFENRGVLLDWSDSIYLKKLPDTFHITIPPTNLQEILRNPTHTALLNGIISQVGLVFFKLNILDSLKVYEHPEKFYFYNLFNILNNH